MTDTKIEDTTEQPVDQSQDSLNIQDLVAYKEIIDIAASRGAFKPNEMVFIGHAYQRLAAFITKVQSHVNGQQNNGEQE